MEFEIKHFHSADVMAPMETWKPGNKKDVCICLEMDIGPVGGDPADIYQCVVATPLGLENFRPDNELILEDRATILVREFDWPKIKKRLAEIVKKCEGEDQIETQWKLQRYFQWEYEDYQMED